jgi:hypothetical protein
MKEWHWVDRGGDGYNVSTEVALWKWIPARDLESTAPTDTYRQRVSEVSGETPGRSLDGIILNDPLTFPR